MSAGTKARTPSRPEPTSNGAAATIAGNGAALEMTLGEIVELYDAGIGNTARGHAGLNGYNKAVGDRIMLQPFSLTDEIRQKITRVKFILRPFVDEIDKEERARITREVMGDEEALLVPAEDEARQAQWQNLYAKAMKVKHEVHGLHIFKRDDFFRENKNPIPNVTEIALYPITEGSPWREARAVKIAERKPSEEPPGGEA